MDRSQPRTRLSRRIQPQAEPCESRELMSVRGASPLSGILNNPPGTHAVRPNTPVLPFGSPLATATFIDTAATITNGEHVVIGQKSYVGPYAYLNATGGAIKIGSGSAVLDNATIQASGSRPTRAGVLVTIGDAVNVGYGATVIGPSQIGAFGAAARPTGIGPNAVIDRATIEPGAIVGAMARVGPGVTVPAGLFVKPGVSVDTSAEASDPALGKVTAITSSQLSALTTELTRNSQLAAGYTNLYQGNAATGLNPGVDSNVTPNIYNGNLAAVSGTSLQPGPTSSSAPTGINFEPARTGPKFPGPHNPQVEGLLPSFPARVTGDARFATRAHVVANRLGRRNAFRADQGQPITFAGAPNTGMSVTINSPLGGTVTSGGVTHLTGSIRIGTNLVAQNGAVLLGGSGTTYPVGNNVTIGSRAVVERTTLGDGAILGARSVVIDSTVAPGTVIPPGTILINNAVVGQVEW